MLLRRGCTWLTLMPLLLSLSTGELSFYRDALPETSEDLALEHVARYLKTQRLQQRVHRSYQPMFLPPVHKEHEGLQLDHQNVLEDFVLSDKVREDLLRLRRKLKALHHRPNKYPMKIIETEYPTSYYNRNFKHYPDYPEEKERNEDDKRFSKNFEPTFALDKDILELMEDFRMREHNHAIDMHHEGGREAGSAVRPAAEAEDGPEFTFSFDDSNLEERHPFAVKPNDPRFYSDAPFSSDNFDRQDALRANWKEEKSANKGDGIFIRDDDDTRSINRKEPEDSSSEFDSSYDSDLERFEHQAGKLEQHPIIVPINHDFNNDIYFIAIVAGCSAAAMFALVLITLTWCRLQRGAKAAADIEYPAYGVTGPNKDVSPSGDQRLAQSAQMYHFQHQKQQIIAMENRTSATRDPGSLSEAESDEENEEGDYTVYECPGLASTGEMEVKNPMFHDDPTPATPQGNNKEEDHI